MRVVNKLTNPGNIRWIDLTPDTVRIQTSDGQDRLYKVVREVQSEQEQSGNVRHGADSSEIAQVPDTAQLRGVPTHGDRVQGCGNQTDYHPPDQ